jgi:hypothetical protein
MIIKTPVRAPAEAVADAPMAGLNDFLKSLPDAVDAPPKKVDAVPKPEPTQADGATGPDAGKPADRTAVGLDAAGGAGKPDATGKQPDSGAAAASATAAPDDIEKLTIPKSAKDWDKAKATFREKEAKLAEQIKARDTELESAKARVAELEASTSKAAEPDPQVEALKKEVADLHDAFIKTSVERDPKFVAWYENETSKAMTKAKTLAGPDKADAIEKLIKLPDSDYKKAQIEEFLADIDSDYTKTRLIKALDAFDDIEASRQADIADADKTRKKFQIESQAQIESRVKTNKAGVEQAIKMASDPANGSPLFQKRAGDDAWNKGVDQRIGAVQELLLHPDKISPQEAVKAAFMAVSLPTIAAQYATERKSWAEKEANYQAQIAALTGAQPGRGNTTQPAQGGAQPSKTPYKPGATPDQALKDWAKDVAEMARA